MLIPSVALAEEQSPDTTHAYKLAVDLGALVMNTPEYEGSEHNRWRLLPIISFEYDKRYFFSAKGLGVKLYPNEVITFAASLGYRQGRDEADDQHLQGLGDVGSGLTANVSVKAKVSLFQVGLSASKQFSGAANGALLSASIGTMVPVGAGFMLRPTAKLAYADSNYMQEYFSVSANQAVASGLAKYDATAGWQSAGVGLSLIKSINKHWRAFAGLNYKKLLDDAAASPITQTSDQMSYTIGLSRSLKF